MESSPLTSSATSSSPRPPPQRPSRLRSFCVFCPSLSGDREDRAEDNILFYYPPSDHPNRQLNQVGFNIAVASLCERFSYGPASSAASHRREATRTGRAREHDIQCRERVISLCNPMEDLWLAAELPTPVATDRSTMQIALSRCFDLFFVLYGRAVVEGLLVPPMAMSRATASSRAALYSHCTAFVTYLAAHLDGVDQMATPHLTLTSPVLDITANTSRENVPRTASAATALDLRCVTESTKERLHVMVEAALWQFRASVAPSTLDFDVPRARRHGHSGWETLSERRRPVPTTEATPPCSSRAARRRQAAASQVMWAVLCGPPASSGNTRTYTLAVAGETFPRRLLALVMTYMDVYGVPARDDLVPFYVLSSSPAPSKGPSHWLMASLCGEVIVVCVVPAIAIRDAAGSLAQRWTNWLAQLTQRASQYVFEERVSGSSTAADDAHLLIHGADVLPSEVQRQARSAGVERFVSLFSPHRNVGLPGAPVGCWLMHGTSIIRGPSPQVVAPLVWRTMLRLMSYVRDKKASSSKKQTPPENLWLPCGGYWLSLSIATSDPDGTNGDMLVSVFHMSQKLEPCFRTARELSTSLLL